MGKVKPGPILFKIPKSRLQKSALLADKSAIESEYLKIIHRKGNIRFKKKAFTIEDFEDLTLREAIKEKSIAINTLHSVKATQKIASKTLKKISKDLHIKKKEIFKKIIELQDSCEHNIKNREQAKEECASAVYRYLMDTKKYKTERAKQHMLIKIGLSLEELVSDLDPYEQILGTLAFQKNAFKSKGDTLDIRQNILKDRRREVIEKQKEIMADTEELKKKLFYKVFQYREMKHAALNTIHNLLEKEGKSMRTVFDNEGKIAKIRQRAHLAEAETARFYWFIDWILKDVIVLDNIDESNLLLSPEEKTQKIIENYKCLKVLINENKT